MKLSNLHTTLFRQEKGILFQKLRVVGQLFDSYILCAADKEKFIIDQHAAHEKIRYEKIKQDYYQNSKLEMQNLIQPVLIRVTAERHRRILLANLEKIRKFGYKIEFTGADTFTVWSVPTFAYRRVVPSIIKKIKDTLLNIESQRITEERIIQLLACHSAIHANMKLRRIDMYKLIVQLGNLQNPWVCPHGRPIIRKLSVVGEIMAISISKKELDKQFKRS